MGWDPEDTIRELKEEIICLRGFDKNRLADIANLKKEMEALRDSDEVARGLRKDIERLTETCNKLHDELDYWRDQAGGINPPNTRESS